MMGRTLNAEQYNGRCEHRHSQTVFRRIGTSALVDMADVNKQLFPGKHVIDAFNGYANAVCSGRRYLAEASRTLATQRDALLPQLVSGEAGFDTYRHPRVS